MGSSLAVSVIAASSAVVVAALSYLFTKAKEREADWRKWKYEQYKQFVASISGITGTDSTPEGNQVFAEACNTLHLIGSKGVIDSMHAFRRRYLYPTSTSQMKNTMNCYPGLFGKFGETQKCRIPLS